jgi:hypothetical protein
MVTLSDWAQGEISIFSCESKVINIPRSVVSPPPEIEKNEVGLVVYYIGSRLGEIRLDEDQFSKLIENAQAEDKSGAPMFGPGYEYVIRDGKGRHFIVFFEYKKGHKSLTGFRAAIAPLADLGSKGAVFVGDPYAGAIFDKTLLATLKAITEKRLEQASVPNGP